MSQRQDFVEAWARGHWHPSELCARFGISRKTGYKWWHRFERGGLPALVDESRRPDRCPFALDAALGALLIRTRQVHPTWGPRKLLAYLIARQPRDTGWPVASTVGALLKRAGLVRARRRRPVPGHPGRPFTPMDAPNALWSADFKEQFKRGTGAYCYPLTIVDGYFPLPPGLPRPGVGRHPEHPRRLRGDLPHLRAPRSHPHRQGPALRDLCPGPAVGPPVQHYRPSPQPYARALRAPEYP
jgi:transposase